MENDALEAQLTALREEMRLLRRLVGIVLAATVQGGTLALATTITTFQMSGADVGKTIDAACEHFLDGALRLADGVHGTSEEALQEALTNENLARTLKTLLKDTKDS